MLDSPRSVLLLMDSVTDSSSGLGDAAVGAVVCSPSVSGTVASGSAVPEAVGAEDSD